MRLAALLLGIVLLAPACGKAPATDRAPAKTACAAASVGREDGPLPPVGSMQASDATGTGAVTAVSTGACTRVTVALLGPNGAGAQRAGPLAATFLRSYGILRVPLPAAVTQVAQAECVFEGGLVHAAYVVHGADGMRLDVHLGAPAKALGA